MRNGVTISIYEVVGSPLCVASSDGEKVHDRIAAALNDDRKVTISFLNVSTLTSAFLNAAIGQLYGEFNEKTIQDSLKIEDIQPDDLELLKRVVDTAKLYFKDPKRFDAASREVLGDPDDGE